jgi:hypothetical protein
MRENLTMMVRACGKRGIASRASIGKLHAIGKVSEL